jgi:anti-sigma regulatory factor (Ser/Thr protein kinase)
MESERDTAGDAGPRSRKQRPAAPSELDALRVACRRQAEVIDTLTAAVSTLRDGAAALKAENTELRAANQRVGRNGGAVVHVAGGLESGETLEASLPLDRRAPGAARLVVGELRGRVATSVLETAELVVSELVSNSVSHSDATAGAVVTVRVRLARTTLRLEVEDPGHGGVVAPRAPDLEAGGGFGLNIVQAVSERWGLERELAGATRVWAQLACAPPDAPTLAVVPAPADRARPSRNGKPAGGRVAAKRRPPPAEGTP